MVDVEEEDVEEEDVEDVLISGDSTCFSSFGVLPELSGNEETVDPVGIAFVEVSFPRTLFPNEDKL